MDDKFDNIIIIIVIIIVLVVTVLVVLSIKSDLVSAEETIERCKSKGWDGAKFKSGFTNEMICSNLSQAEKDARGVGK